MALSHGLTEDGHKPDRLEVSATVTFTLESGPRVSSSHITVRGTVPGIDADGFAAAAQGAGENCPVSAALKGNVDITVDAQLA
jgi:osmotically inducible protein OsmC